MKCGAKSERINQRVINKRTTISLKGKFESKTSCKCSSKKYPLYRLAISPLELLDRKPYEMHPLRSNGVGGLCAFFWLLFFAQAKKSDWHVGPPPTVLIEHLNKPIRKMSIGLTLRTTPTPLTLKPKTEN